jgi:uncharacterized protein
MNTATRIDVTNFIRDNLLHQTDEPGKLRVTWVGGEPLYDIKVLSELAEQIFDSATQQNYEVSAYIITNGVLFKERIAKKLKKPPFCVDSIQVTLDGPKKLHDRVRFFKDKRPSFDIICENKALAKKNVAITIRIGIVADFEASDFKCLLKELFERKVLDEKNENTPRIFMARICPCKSDHCTTGKAMFMSRFAKLELECAKIAKEMGVNLEIASGWEKPKSTSCSNLGIDNFAIDVDGNISKCFESMGREEDAIGNVRKGIDRRSIENQKWVTYTPFIDLDAECRECRILPLCKKGCPRLVMRGEGKECSPLKYNLDKRLLFHYLGE